MDDYFNPGDDAQWDPERKNGTLSYTISGYISRAPATGAMWAVTLAPIMNMFFSPDNFARQEDPSKGKKHMIKLQVIQYTSFISQVGF